MQFPDYFRFECSQIFPVFLGLARSYPEFQSFSSNSIRNVLSHLSRQRYFFTFSLPLPQNVERTIRTNRIPGALLKEKLLINAHKIARSVGADAITYICTSSNDRERAKRVGLTTITIQGYDCYRNENGTKIFTDMCSGQHYAELVGVDVGPRAITSVGNWMLSENKNGKRENRQK